MLERLACDLRRSQLLAQYLPAWGLPIERQTYLITARGADIEVEFYLFAGEDADQVSRFVSIGLSAAAQCDFELLLVLPADLAERQSQQIFAFLHNQAQLSLLQWRQFESCYAATQMHYQNLPKGWPEQLLFDRAFSEIEQVQKVFVGFQAVELAWLVPLHLDEMELIKTQGLEAFDRQLAAADLSLLEPLRPSCCEP